jgi:hypothetical protein
MHTWLGTQTEGGGVRRSISCRPVRLHQHAGRRENANLNAKYDVILFRPRGSGRRSFGDADGGTRAVEEFAGDAEHQQADRTDDIRPGLGWRGLADLESFVAKGGVLVGVANTAEFAVQFGLTNGVSASSAKSNSVVGSLLRTKLVDETSPIVYGVSDNLAVYSDDGGSFSVSNTRGGRVGFGGGSESGRATGRGTAEDPDVTQGRPVDPKFEAPPRPTVQPWQAAPITDDQLRSPISIIPPDQRPRVPLRFADQKELLVSGLLDGGSDIAQRPVVVDVPMQKGHIVLFANNPLWRGETIGSYALVFNTMLSWDNLNAGRKLDEK